MTHLAALGRDATTVFTRSSQSVPAPDTTKEQTVEHRADAKVIDTKWSPLKSAYHSLFLLLQSR